MLKCVMDQNSGDYSKGRFGLLKVPGGLDRSWETKRLQGLEMLGQSLEHQRERNLQKSVFQDISVKKKSRHKKRCGASAVTSELFRDFLVMDINDASRSKLHEDCGLRLEYQMQELSRQLMIERQKNRQDKLNIARLQQELARHKSERPFKDMLTKELEREHRIRLEAEQCLSRMTVDCCNYKEKVSSLENDLKKMTDLAQSLATYKTKFEELQHEGMTSSFDGNTLYSDEGERTKVLLERLRMLEAEKTSLVLENENQSHVYEKCLDDITGQVLEALVTQRNLKEECFKLRNRVSNLQQQNIQLRNIFQQQLALNPEVLCLMTADEKLKTKMHRSFTGDVGISLNSLNSIFSEQDQMQLLLCQISSPSAEFQDSSFLTESGTLPASFSNCLSATEKYEEKAGDGDDSARLSFNRTIAQHCEKMIPDDGHKQIKEMFGNDVDQDIGTSMPHKIQNNSQDKYMYSFGKCVANVLVHKEDHSLQCTESRKQHHKTAKERKSDLMSAEVSCDMRLPRNDVTNQTALNAASRSADSDCDSDADCSCSQLDKQFDTGSTVSLNELLDSAVTDVDFENTSAFHDTSGNCEDSILSQMPNMSSDEVYSVMEQPRDSNFKDHLSYHVFTENTGQNVTISLPDVCPNHFSRNRNPIKPF